MSRIAVCSWSLQPTDARDLAERARACGIDAVQLALDPVRSGLMPVDEVRRTLADADIAVLSGMMAMGGEDYSTIETIRRTGGLVQPQHFEANLEAAGGNARIARALGVSLVTFHAGFIPEEGEPARALLAERLRRMREAFAAEEVEVALETGQEDAGSLLSFLDEAGGDIGVNFDPANMILYGTGDPVVALRSLAPFVRQVHVKDALPSDSPGQWGVEKPAGEGAVEWPAFFEEVPAGVDLVIEREAGEDRTGDVRQAAELIRRHLEDR
jgi:sugar phosphate isomerase/epimerase